MLSHWTKFNVLPGKLYASSVCFFVGVCELNDYFVQKKSLFVVVKKSVGNSTVWWLMEKQVEYCQKCQLENKALNLVQQVIKYLKSTHKKWIKTIKKRLVLQQRSVQREFETMCSGISVKAYERWESTRTIAHSGNTFHHYQYCTEFKIHPHTHGIRWQSKTPATSALGGAIFIDAQNRWIFCRIRWIKSYMILGSIAINSSNK